LGAPAPQQLNATNCKCIKKENKTLFTISFAKCSPDKKNYFGNTKYRSATLISALAHTAPNIIFKLTPMRTDHIQIRRSGNFDHVGLSRRKYMRKSDTSI
jgi:hypothetical protein